MAKEISIIKELEEKYFDQFEREKELKFSNGEELVEFIAMYFTKKYCKNFIYWKSAEREETIREHEIRQMMIETRILPIFSAFKTVILEECKISNKKKKNILSKLGIKNYDIIIIDTNKHSKIYEKTLNIIQSYLLPENEFPDETYSIEVSRNIFKKVQQ